MKKRFFLVPFLFLLGIAKAYALGFFLIPLVMGITVISALGVGAFCEVDQCFANNTVSPGSKVLTVKLKHTVQGGAQKEIEVPVSKTAAVKTVGENKPADGTSGWYKAEFVYIKPSLSKTGEEIEKQAILDTDTRPVANDGVSRSRGEYPTLDEMKGAYRDILRRYRTDGQYWDMDYTNIFGNCTAVGSGTYCRIPAMTQAGCTGDWTNVGGWTGCHAWFSHIAGEAKDGIKRMKFNADKSGYEKDLNDPDWDPADRAEVYSASSSVVVRGDSSSVTVTRRGSGRTDISVAKPITASQTQVRNASVNASDEVDAIVSQLMNSSLDAAITAAVSGSLLDPAPSSEGEGGTGAFPSDYARTGEAQAAVDGMKNSLDDIKGSLTNSSEVSDPSPGAWSDPWGNEFNALRGWRLPQHSSECPIAQWVSPLNGQVVSISAHCQLAVDNFPMLSGAMILVWSLSALFIVLRA